MRIPRRPTEVRTTLPEHADQEDAPVFVYRFPTPQEEVRITSNLATGLLDDPEVRKRIFAAAEEDRLELVQELLAEGAVEPDTRRFLSSLVELFDELLVRIEHLEIDAEDEAAEPEPFDRERDLDQVPGEWKVAVGREIYRRLQGYLAPREVGNSSSPSSSPEGTTVGSTPDPSPPDQRPTSDGQ